MTATDILQLPQVSLANRNDLPDEAGLYIAHQDGKPLYIGRTASLRRRWKHHARYFQMIALENVRIAWILLAAEELNYAEARMIQELRPPFNQQCYTQLSVPVVERAMKEVGGDVRLLAVRLCISRAALYAFFQRTDIERPPVLPVHKHPAALVEPKTRNVKQYFCERCKKWWTPKGEPVRCGKCKSPYWRTKGKQC